MFVCPVLLLHPSQHLLVLDSRMWPARAALASLAAWPGVEAVSPASLTCAGQTLSSHCPLTLQLFRFRYAVTILL